MVDVDASTPALAAASNDPWTSAAFNPPAGSLLVVGVACDDFNNNPTITVTSTGLTFQSRVRRDANDAGSHEGLAEFFTAPVASAGSRTVSVTTTEGFDTGGVKVWVVTGHDATSPVDAVGSGSSTTNAITPTVLTTVTDGAWVFGMAAEWQSNGTPTSTDVEEGFDDADLSLIAVRKAAATSPAGAVTLNFDAGGGSAAQWNWVAVAIKPAAGGGGSITGSGSLTAAPAQADGAGAVTVSGSGSVTAPTATLAGSGSAPAAGSGAAVAAAAAVAGTGTVVVSGSGALVAPAATLSGTGVIGEAPATGSGEAVSPAVVVSGTGGVEATGSGAAASPAAVASGTGSAIATGSGELVAAAAAVVGSGTVADPTIEVPVAVIVGAITGPARVEVDVSGPGLARTVTGPALSRTVAGPSNSVETFTGPALSSGPVTAGPGLARTFTGPTLARTVTGVGA